MTSAVTAKVLWSAVRLILLLVAVAGCYDARRSNPLDSAATPGVSVAVDQTAGRESVTINWTPYDGAVPFREYWVLRQTARKAPAAEAISLTEEYFLVTTKIAKVETLAVIADPAATSFQIDSVEANSRWVYRISVVNSVGLESTSEASPPVVGPFMQQLSFYTDRTGDWEVFLINIDGSGLQNLTNHPGEDGPVEAVVGRPVHSVDRGEVGRPAWSPDGSRIAFVSSRDGNREIYVMDADGGNQVNLTNHSAVDHFPAWSPDGDKIAFGSDRGGSFEIYLMNADGTDPVQLTTGDEDDHAPDWSPDGTRIIFWSGLKNKNGFSTSDLFTVNADGNGIGLLVPTDGWDTDPVWSPDGGRIAYVGAVGVNLLDANGSNPERLINRGRAPHWSSDGSQLAYTCNGDGDDVGDVCVANADGTSQVNITNHPANDMWGAFRPVVE